MRRLRALGLWLLLASSAITLGSQALADSAPSKPGGERKLAELPTPLTKRR